MTVDRVLCVYWGDGHWTEYPYDEMKVLANGNIWVRGQAIDETTIVGYERYETRSAG